MIASNITIVIIGFILVLALVDISSQGKHHKDFRSVIVVAGIFGTFLGIYIGLQDFNTSDIASSVPGLLDGMKTAFLTSVVGLGVSGSLTTYSIWTGKETPDEMGALKAVENKLQEAVDEVKNGFKITNYNLEHALNKLSEGATEEIIKALNNVIADFNNNLKEQFGDNFKQLNEAVVKLLAWQEHYAQHVESTEELLLEATVSLETSAKANRESAAAVHTIHEAIGEILKAANLIHEEANRTENALETQKKLVVELESLFTSLNKNLTDTSEKTSELTKSISKSLAEQSQTLSTLSSDISKKLPESLGQLERTLSGLTMKFGEDYQSFLQAVSKLIKVPSQ